MSKQRTTGHVTSFVLQNPDIVKTSRNLIDGITPSSDGIARTRSQIISVVIPTRNRIDQIEHALASILEGTRLPLEIIVVDQSNPELVPALAEVVQSVTRQHGFSLLAETECFPLVRFIHSDTVGAGTNRNLGAAAAHGEIILFMDDDCLAGNDWIEMVEQEYSQHADIQAVYGRILPPMTIKRNGTEIGRRSTERRVFDRPVKPWHIGSGGNMSFRREAFLKCGGFDEVMNIGGALGTFEDLDIGYRLLRRGLKIVYTGKSLVYHDSKKDFEQQIRTEKSYGKGVGAATAKYLRCGWVSALLVLWQWYWHMAIRRTFAGILKWHSIKVVRLALLQFWYPFVGLIEGLTWPLDRVHHLYQPKVSDS
ncbi:MAG: glycosyltransferase [Chloroflexi bacterium]|uniref:Glycosyltransferase n=1 Tax=Candidatus Chlorohelix allophototropha TaxID=3003348 RepID=A0A8T7M360_9CHLR|nr:glycosyltransferase [Chloroflexota bacterium]WJW67916.1 glycosyltransferase [Chloroflexota bacterium L227-S17]